MTGAMARFKLLPVLLVLAVTGCRTAPERVAEPTRAEFPAARYHALAAGEGQVFWLDPKASEIRIYIYRAGVLAAQGHNHLLTVANFQGAVYLPTQGLDQARFDVVIPVAGLQVDPSAVRQAVGGSFAGEVTAEDRAGTRANMLGPAVLDAERFPALAVRSLTVAGELPKLVIRTAISLRGVVREQWLPVDIQLEHDTLQAQGALVIRQQEFGITPFSALGGLLRVQDALLIEYRLVGRL